MALSGQRLGQLACSSTTTRDVDESHGKSSTRADEDGDGESSTRTDESSGDELLVKTTSEVVPRSDLLSQGLV